MRTTFSVASLFLALTLPVFVASLVTRNNTCPPDKPCPTCPTPSQFCSKCPRQNVAGDPLRAALDGGSHYTQCSYKDTDCYYWSPDSSSPNTFASGFPAGACPQGPLGDEVCSDPLPPIPPIYLTTRCPDTNQAYFGHELLINEVKGNPNGYIQCHYPMSECYYLPGGALVEEPSIPKASPDTTPPVPASCRPNLVDEHYQNGY